jgi:hypothetical protein
VIEDWKQALDKNEYLAAMKLKANCLSQSALEMLNSYLANRKQCVKIGQNTSDLLDIVKGVPQGSILVPILFKIFVNDLFFFVHKCELYNYADDNTLSKSDKPLENGIASLEENSKALINWFSVNKMQANFCDMICHCAIICFCYLICFLCDLICFCDIISLCDIICLCDLICFLCDLICF